MPPGPRRLAQPERHSFGPLSPEGRRQGPGRSWPTCLPRHRLNPKLPPGPRQASPEEEADWAWRSYPHQDQPTTGATRLVHANGKQEGRGGDQGATPRQDRT